MIDVQVEKKKKKGSPPPRFSPPAGLKVTCPPRGRGLMSRSHISPPPTVTFSCHFQTGTELISQALLPRWHLKNWRVFCDGGAPMFYIWLENTSWGCCFLSFFGGGIFVVTCLYSWGECTSNESLSESPGCRDKIFFPGSKEQLWDGVTSVC